MSNTALTGLEWKMDKPEEQTWANIDQPSRHVRKAGPEGSNALQKSGSGSDGLTEEL